MADEADRGMEAEGLRAKVLREIQATRCEFPGEEDWIATTAEIVEQAYITLSRHLPDSLRGSFVEVMLALDALSTAIRTRTLYHLSSAITEYHARHGLRAEALARFMCGDKPPGPAALSALLWYMPADASEHLARMPYADFLQTSYWKCVRAMAMERDGNRCRMCNSTGPIQVHHRTYEHRGMEHEHLDDLTTLCAPCHQRHHKGDTPR